MSIFTRFVAIYQARAHDIVRQAEDPKASLDYSLTKLEEIRAQINRSLIEVSAAHRRLENQRDELEALLAKHQGQARAALSAGRDDLARIALERKEEASARLREMDISLVNLERQLDNLKDSQSGLERKIALFQSKKEELKAIYDASKAQVKIRESLVGISADLADVGSTIRRAEARIREMQSRAEAIDGLVAEGVLTDSLERGYDDIDRELARIGKQQAVDTELLRLKDESGSVRLEAAQPQLSGENQPRLNAGEGETQQPGPTPKNE